MVMKWPTAGERRRNDEPDHRGGDRGRRAHAIIRYGPLAVRPTAAFAERESFAAVPDLAA
jgi:hypothetical protein